MKPGLCSLFPALLISVASLELTAQRGSSVSRIYTMNEGVPETAVNWILQDSRGFIWVATYDGLSKFDGYKFATYKRNPTSANSLGHNIVTRLCEDDYGRLWVGHHAGLDLFDPQTEEFYHFPGPNPDSQWKVNRFRLRRDGKLWICSDDGIYVANTETLSIEKMKDLPDDVYWDIAETRDGSVWIAGARSVIHIDGTAGQTSFYKHELNDPDGLPHGLGGSSIYVDEQHKVWIGGTGLNLFDEASKSFTRYLTGYRISHVSGNSDGKLIIGRPRGLLLFDPKTGKHEKITEENDWPASIAKDRQGIIWYASFMGLNQINPKIKKFRWEQQFNWIGGIAEDGGHDVWILSSSGIFRFDPSLKNVLERKRRNGVAAMTVDGEGSIWFISSDKLEKYDFRSQTISAQAMSVSDGRRFIQPISFVDSFGSLWTGGWAGAGKYNSRTNRIEQLESAPVVFVTCFVEDPYKNLWIGSSAGLWRYNLISRKFDVFENDPADRQSLSDNSINHMMMDGDQNMWIGTGTGLNKIIRGTENDEPKFARWQTGTSGLPTNFITGIVDGGDGTLWLACSNVISHFDPKKNTFRNYYDTDFTTAARFTIGFTFGKGLRTSEGKIIFGGLRDGLVIFHPDSLADNPYVPPVVITDFLINDQRVPIAKTEADTLAWESPLKKEISYTNAIELTYLQNDFAFEFAALNYVNAERNRYKYRLEPYERQWIETNASNRIARYTNIDPGTYTFHVIGSNNDGVWNEEGTRITILITPPWWQTWWAYSFYGFTLIGIFLFWRRYENKRLELKHRAEHLSELDNLKSRFFANISHEFRTPITLILGPLEDLYKKASSDDQKSVFGTMLRNSQRILRLINQLLDLSKVDAGKMKLRASRTDLVQFLREIASSYESLATDKQIRYFFYPEVRELVAFIDQEKIEKVVHNLLSNAFKFTKGGGEVILNLKVGDKQSAWISVSDTGIGIQTDQLDKVFDRFYQVDSSQTRGYEGSGLGMALAKELVELHRGKISVESTEGKGTTFSVWLLLGKDHLREEEIVVTGDPEKRQPLSEDIMVSNEPTATETNDEGGKPTVSYEQHAVILIVEDNSDMRNYMRKILSEYYHVHETSNGKEGLEKAKECLPDLIISDVMMPEMDGYQLCEKIKTHELTSHVPVILLTAKGDRESKLSGLKVGADDYLSKPFDADELKLIIRNRIEDRRKMRERFSREITLEPTQLQVSSLDEKFLNKVLTAIEAHMENEDFSIEDFSHEAGYSRMQFYRKIKALTGQTPTDFVRTIRLKRAAQLLRDRSDNVAQVAYSVGFRNLSHFNKSFKALYGVTPGQFTKADPSNR